MTPTPPIGNRMVVSGIDRVLTVQRPVVLAHIRSIRAGRPDASPEEVIRTLERRYLAAVTTGGALVGASAVIPAVGVGAALTLSTAETAGFLEASALYAQSVTEVHGIAIEDPDRARALVMTLILGSAGTDLLKQLAAQAAGTGPTRTLFWGELVTKNLPQAAMGQIANQLKRTFVRRFSVTQGTNIIGRAIPFGIGAVVGGTGNHLLGRQIIRGSREAFPPPPRTFPPILEPRVREPKAGVTDLGEAKASRVPRILRRRQKPLAIDAGVAASGQPSAVQETGDGRESGASGVLPATEPESPAATGGLRDLD